MSGFETEAVRKLFNIEDHLVNGLIIPIGKAQTPGFETVRRDVFRSSNLVRLKS